ncbi:ATP-grasp fold amidoligase family protein [uncultured Clostridium sp.]|uniref:ATP-grasp fold amidoligase family protein n=1 Tax=uncultured Clostridium sp. TaxID=59620 RepID=UPI0025984759|nr:ATP-grasp fold amidoligase family protein [uncultured Clostridium sp.]
MFNKMLKVISNPGIILIKIFGKRINDETYLKIMYKFIMENKLDLNNVTTFNEKLQWLKINDRNPIYTQLVDKYEVREYIKNTIGENYLIPLIGVWNDVKDIEIDNLPDKFVLKTTHDSGTVIICTNKENFNVKLAKNKLKKSMNINYYYQWREWPYKNVTPKIICEEYMIDKKDGELKDYKFMCFSGKVKFVMVCTNRNKKEGLRINFFDEKWNVMDCQREKHPPTSIPIEKPINFEKMIELAERLSKGIPFLRVDFYEINEKIYFGELTFYPASGLEKFLPEKYDYLFGEWIKIPLD